MKGLNTYTGSQFAEIGAKYYDGSSWVEFAVAGPVTYEFDDMSPWTVNYGGQNTGRTYNGSYSFYSGNNNTGKQAEATPYPDGEQISTFEYYYQETSSSTGSGVRLKNSNGNYEGGTATDNSEHDVDFAGGFSELYGGSGNYDEWAHVTWDFDWNNNNVTITFDSAENGSIPTNSSTYSLKNGVDIATIELWNYHAYTWGSNDIDAWWDSISFTP